MALNPFFKAQVQQAHNNKVKIPKRYKQWLYPHTAERDYQRKLNSLFDKLIDITEVNLYPILDNLVSEVKAQRPDSLEIKTDSYFLNLLTAILAKISKQYNDTLDQIDIDNLAQQQASQISAFNKLQFAQVIFSATKVNPIINEPYLVTQSQIFTRNNVNLIKSLSQDQLKRVEEIVNRNLLLGNGVAEIKQELSKTFRITKNRAKLIARDQTSKFNGNLTQLRSQELGIDSYRWSGVLDPRERLSHLANEGKIYYWNKPPANTGHPGHQINCRCIAQPIITIEMFLQ